MEIKKSLIIGLDLSFSSTGICVGYFEDYSAKSIQFHKVVFDENKNKTGKVYTPERIKNINIVTYRMPTNLLVSDMIVDLSDTNNFEQCEVTLKALICCKKIGAILLQNILKYQPTEILFSIENYIMPSFNGPNQLKHVSGLITLQGYVRKLCIETCLSKQISIKIYTPTPSSNKLFFSGNGSAEKGQMIKSFIEDYNGEKLIPTIKSCSEAQVNDVVDAFSLMMNVYSRNYKNIK